MQKKIDDAANMWNKTKDSQYKDLWYKLIREWNNGFNTTERRDVSSSRSNERNDKGNNTVKQSRLF